ncbi:MAG: Wzz/FepE/Etk N-terminal domain-containing protein [Kiloniellaceae bacterium]
MTMQRQENDRDQPSALMSLSLLQVLGVLWRRKAIIVVCIVLALSGAIIANGVITPRYTATASLIVEPRQQKVIEIESVISNLPVSLETMQSEVQVIKSPAVARRVVDGLGLSALAEFDPSLLPARKNLGGDFKAAVKELFQPVIAWLRDEPAGRRGTELAQGPGDWDLPVEGGSGGRGESRIVGRFLSNLDVAIQGASRVIEVSYTTTDPRLSQQIANAVADEYLSDQVRLKTDALAGANSFLGGRIEELRAAVVAAEREVEQFRETTPIISENDSELLAEQIYALNTKQIEAQLDLDTVNERMARLRAAVNLRGSTAAFDGAASTVIDELRLEEMRLRQRESELLSILGPKHPKVVTLRSELKKRRQQMLEEAGRQITSLQSEKEIAQQRLASIRASLEGLQADSDTLNSSQIQLRALQREADATQEVFESFLARYKETSQLGDDQAQSRILSLASIPTGPSFPKTKLNYAVALVLGSGIGGLIILLLELSVPGFRSPEELQQAAGLPVLAVVPRVSARKVLGVGLDRFLEEEPNSAFAEAHKGVFAALKVDRRAFELGHVLLVTSSVPNEGKSIFSRSLCGSLAGSGLNVLRIDCDLRASEEERRLGISDYILADCPLEQVVQVDEDSGQSVIMPGTRVNDPHSVLRSPRLARFIDAASRQYDLVCLDAPPVLAVSDAATLAELADQTVVVVRWQRTPRRFVAATLERLRRNRTHLSGVVMTQAKLTRSAKTNPYMVGYADRSFRKYY